ncbi:MAG: hypothetical protein ACFB20_03225 [Opitutales bacterium]
MKSTCQGLLKFQAARLYAVGLVALALCLGLALPAQGQAVRVQPRTVQAAAHSQSATQPKTEDRITMDFPGGTPAELIEAIDRALGRPINVILPEGSEKLRMPPVRVADADYGYVLQSIQHGEQIALTTSRGGSPGLTTRSITYRDVGYRWEQNRDVWVLRIHQVPMEPHVQQVQTVALGSYLERYRIEDITTAIRLAWDNQPGPASLADSPYVAWTPPKPASLHFHEETQLLVAVATPQEIALMQTTLEELNRQPWPIVQVTLLGAVEEPGTVSLRRDQAVASELQLFINTAALHPDGFMARVDLKAVTLTRYNQSFVIDFTQIFDLPSDLTLEPGDVFTFRFATDEDGNPIAVRRRAQPRRVIETSPNS